MCPAIVGAILTRTLDVGVVVAPHRFCGEPRIDDRLRHFAVVVVGRFELDDDVLTRGVVAEPIDDAASSDVLAGEGFEIDRATIFHVDGLGLRPGREATQRRILIGSFCTPYKRDEMLANTNGKQS